MGPKEKGLYPIDFLLIMNLSNGYSNGTDMAKTQENRLKAVKNRAEKLQHATYPFIPCK